MNYFELLNNNLLNAITYHPMIVHFPIVLIILFTCYSFWTLKVKVNRFYGLTLIGITTIFAHLTKYTGEKAGVVATSTVVSPLALLNHATLAGDLVLIITGILGLYIIVEFKLINTKAYIYGKWMIALLTLVSMTMLTLTAHTGATLVYKYGTGVTVPEKRARQVLDCKR